MRAFDLWKHWYQELLILESLKALKLKLHAECSKQFKWNLYFYVSGQNEPFWAVLKLLFKFKYEIYIYNSMDGAGYKLEKWKK